MLFNQILQIKLSIISIVLLLIEEHSNFYNYFVKMVIHKVKYILEINLEKCILLILLLLRPIN